MRGQAVLIHDRRLNLHDGWIIQIRVWKLPAASQERPHGLKYSLFFGRRNERVVGYDNERGKGDHRHYRSREEPYAFSTMEKLVADFWNDVKREMSDERGQNPHR